MTWLSVHPFFVPELKRQQREQEISKVLMTSVVRRDHRVDGSRVEQALRMGHAEVADTLKRARLTAIDSADAAVAEAPQQQAAA